MVSSTFVRWSTPLRLASHRRQERTARGCQVSPPGRGAEVVRRTGCRPERRERRRSGLTWSQLQRSSGNRRSFSPSNALRWTSRLSPSNSVANAIRVPSNGLLRPSTPEVLVSIELLSSQLQLRLELGNLGLEWQLEVGPVGTVLRTSRSSRFRTSAVWFECEPLWTLLDTQTPFSAPLTLQPLETAALTAACTCATSSGITWMSLLIGGAAQGAAQHRPRRGVRIVFWKASPRTGSDLSRSSARE